MEADQEIPNQSAAVGENYGYQLYKDNTETTYCSAARMNSHAEGSAWIRRCLAAHPGTSASGRPWTSNRQSGTVWP